MHENNNLKEIFAAVIVISMLLGFAFFIMGLIIPAIIASLVSIAANFIYEEVLELWR